MEVDMDKKQSLHDVEDIKSRLLSNGGFINGVCIVCGNTGRTKDSLFECPQCGRKYLGGSDYEDTPDKDLSLAELSGIHIPQKYRIPGNKWNMDVIKNKIQMRIRRQTGKLHIPSDIYKFFSRVDNIYQQVRNRNVDCMANQLFFCAKQDMIDILEIFAYSCMTTVLSQGLTTTCIQSPSLFDIKRDINLMEKDLLIFELNHVDIEQSIYKLEEICSIRSRSDRPTFIITHIDCIRIFRLDINASFDRILHEEVERNVNDTSLIKVLRMSET